VKRHSVRAAAAGSLRPVNALAETDRVCRDRMERIITQMARAEGINEQLKASDQLGWVSRINSIHQRAEEIILDELVFA